ncbi:uncharacterized protein HD556DRAFT_1308229 [Suillus plorans]|uniref:Uncharacterized protein n=1 Tax=Suillus plorans TaxID=116603 RepID=A0A9P7ASH0_9AGAM|nr:uncharacterized protein HD556DRAFT_1308229 [Suillus plorans]KAG1794169.1 hypothetical protein HD556DRAFT_1308229 [Suillus plorans]
MSDSAKCKVQSAKCKVQSAMSNVQCPMSDDFQVCIRHALEIRPLRGHRDVSLYNGPAGDQEPPRVTNPIEDPHIIDDSRNLRDTPANAPANPPQAHHELPVHHDPHNGIQRGSDEGIQRDPHEGDAVCHSREPQREVVDNHRNDPYEDTPHHAPRDTLHDPHQPLHSHSREPWYMHEAVHHHEVHHSREDTPITERDALYPRNAFYHRNSRNYHHAGLQPHDNYGPEPRANSEFAMRDSSPALEDLVLTMLVRVDTLDVMTLMNGGHLVEELTVTMGTLKAGLVTGIPDGQIVRDPVNPPHPPPS